MRVLFSKFISSYSSTEIIKIEQLTVIYNHNHKMNLYSAA